MTQDDVTQLEESLRGIPGISVIAEDAGLRVRCERVGAAALVAPTAVLLTKPIVDPFGDPSLLLLMSVGGRNFQAVLSPNDLVFGPDDTIAIGDMQGPPIRVGNMPPMLGYSELLRELSFWEKSMDDIPSLDRIFGSLAMMRYFIGGAARFGIDHRELLSRWHALWDRFNER